jgi:co-chaperonin GroES (HSP10)
MNEAVVIAVGPGHRDTNGVLVPMTVAVGDMVLLPGFGGVGVKIGSEVSFFFFYSESLFFRVPCVAM